MIDIQRKEDCCGCNACVQRCPQHCISMHMDDEGFLYPKVDTNLCINCGLCEKVCPVINQTGPRKPQATYAAKNPDKEIQLMSSSGGIFSAIAEQVIKNGGVVFGARFNDKWEVVHDYTEKIEGLEAFRGSKYVQSRIGDNFLKAEDFLKAGRVVLFSGTPCQIAGLKHFLRKDYPNLLAIDVACHGVSSPIVWKKYLKGIIIKHKDSCLKDILFRDKRYGWINYGLSLKFDSKKEMYSPMRDNLYMQLFLSNLDLRPSCHACPAKCGKSLSDITLGDFWGIEKINKSLYDDKGVSLLLVYTELSKKVIFSSEIIITTSDYEEAVKYNTSLIINSPISPYREIFWKLLKEKGLNSTKKIVRSLRPSIFKKIIARLKKIVNKIKDI